MPEVTSKHIRIAVDMFGCPNRCRHCYLGRMPNARMSENDVRWIREQFRGLAPEQGIDVVTWQREPDYSDDYRHLYELEVELSDVQTYRAEWELMSVWRTARDESYAPWAHSIGLRTCQITFLGVGETQDWFYRRRGAFDDCLIATERLLAAGIKPRWQVFLTDKSIPELDELMLLVDQMRLRERCSELGGEFVMFAHTPVPCGEAEFIEDLRPTIDDVAAIPADLIQATERHFGERISWRTVGDRVLEILASEQDTFPYACSATNPPWFIVNCDWDVFSNAGNVDPWWGLGNLRSDPIEEIVANFEHNKPLALHTAHNLPLRELAERYGDPGSRLIDGGVANLWLAHYCRERWSASDATPGARICPPSCL